MRNLMLGWMLAAGISAMAGTVGPPVEKIALPITEENTPHLIVVWDEELGSWVQNNVPYDNMGVYDFSALVFDKWYWIGLWDSKAKRYVFEKWIGHFKTDG